jgi:hypothetical protein
MFTYCEWFLLFYIIHFWNHIIFLNHSFKRMKKYDWGSTRLQSVENSLWKGLWTCHKTDYLMFVCMNEWMNELFNSFYNQSYKIIKSVHRVNFWWDRLILWGYPNSSKVNPLSPELNPICYLLALLAHDFLHVSRIRVKSLTLKLLMSYIYMCVCVCDISNLMGKLIVNIFILCWVQYMLYF